MTEAKITGDAEADAADDFEKPERDAKGRLLPGHSGNLPATSKKHTALKHVKDLARQHTVEAVNTLVSIMKNKKAPAAARVSAAGVILDRGFGRAPAVVEINPDKEPHEFTNVELRNQARAFLVGEIERRAKEMSLEEAAVVAAAIEGETVDDPDNRPTP